MEYRRLGSAGMKVSAVSLGGWINFGEGEDSRFAREEWAKERFFTEENVEKVRRLKRIAGDLGITRAQLALAWVLRHSGVSSVITGATKVSQVEDNVGAAEVSLSGDVVEEIETILRNKPEPEAE